MELDKTLLVNMIISLVAVFVAYYAFQAVNLKFEESHLPIFYMAMLIYLELERKNR